MTRGGLAASSGRAGGGVDIDGDGIPDSFGPGRAPMQHDPDEMDSAGKGWAGLGTRMGDVQARVGALSVGSDGMGFVKLPNDGYTTMNTASNTWARNGASIFNEFGHELHRNAIDYRDHASRAESSIKSIPVEDA